MGVYEDVTVMEGFVSWPSECLKAYTEKGYWSGLTVGETFDQTAGKYPDAEILVSEEARITYSEMALAVKRLALGLVEIGVQKEDRIILLLPNIPELVYMYLALGKIGAIGVWALPQHRQNEIGYLLNKTNAVGITIPDEYKNFDFVKMVKEMRSSFPYLKHVLVVGESIPKGALNFKELLNNPIENKYPSDYLDRFKPDANVVLGLLLTGGTMAFPKIVPRTHNSLLLASLCGTKHRGHHTPGTVYLLNIHMGHGAGMQRLTGSIVQSGSKVILRKKLLPELMLQAIETERVTHTGLVPTQAHDLVNHPDFDKYDLSALKSIDLPGAPSSVNLLKTLKTKIPHCDVHIAFGSNEGLMFSNRPEDTFEMVCEGRVRPICPGDELKIIDDDGNTVPEGVVGELIGRGPNIIRGYYKSPELNQALFDADGFWHTKDLFMKCSDGTFKAFGRKDDMIIRGGENISAKEIEEHLASHSSIADVAVVAMPDRRLGQRACAFIMLNPGQNITFEEIIIFLKEKSIATFKLPERMELIDEFPLTNIGKISKKELRATIADKLKAEGKI